MQSDQITVGASTYDKLKHDIIFGEIKAGTKLKLGQLKTRYNASVSTLREMLNRLASEGFVDAQEQRGFFVTDMSQDDLVEISKLRILLECDALRASIKNATTEWEGNVVAAHHKLHSIEKKMLAGDSTELETWKRYDWEFHLALIQGCDNKNLLRLHSIIYDKYLRYQIAVLTSRGQSAVDEHNDLFQASLDGNADLATEILIQHVENGLSHARERLLVT